MFFCFHQQPRASGRERAPRDHDSGVLLWHARRWEGTRRIARALGPKSSFSETPEDPEHKKQAVLPAVRGLQLPYVGSSNVPNGAVEVTGSGNGTLSPHFSPAHDLDPDPTRCSLRISACRERQYTPKDQRYCRYLQVNSMPMLQPQHPTCASGSANGP
jgi:hypothetical protein